MYEALFAYIKRYSNVHLTSNEIEIIHKSWVPQKLKKRETLLHRGEICKQTAFIVKGAMRQYSVDDSGNEHTIQLAIENWWIVDRESYLMRTPSVYNIEAWEDTQLLILKRKELEDILEFPAIKEMFWHMDQNNYIASQKRLNDAISLTALNRYENLLKYYPDFVKRFPQHIIASYLGIKKETLSRIRSQLSQQ
jgi:CRP-like cAMP-binding protein